MSNLSEEEIIIECNKLLITLQNNHIDGKIIQILYDLYQQEKKANDIDLTIVYMNGFYDGEDKWKKKIREKRKAILKEGKNMTEEERQKETMFLQGKLIALEELLNKGETDEN